MPEMTDDVGDRAPSLATRRREDPGLITGARQFVSDLTAPDVLHAAFVRSIVPHGTITAIQADLPPGAQLFTDADLGAELEALPAFDASVSRPLLAREVVRFVGEPIAVVLADSEIAARDAADGVWVDTEPLDAVADADRALDGDAPLLFPELGTNLVWTHRHGLDGDPLDGAEVIVSHRLVQQRLAPAPMEPSAVMATPDGSGGLLVEMGTQNLTNARTEIAKTLGVSEDRVHVAVPAMGGGFGAKGPVYPEQLVVAALALRLGRPVRWVERRTENLVNMVHGRGQIQYIELGATRDGKITGLKVRYRHDAGAYPTVGAVLGRYTVQMSSGVYDIPKFAGICESVVTNRTPIGPYRGAGRPEAAQMIERTLDLLADELGMDRIEVRRRNLMAKFDGPRHLPTGVTYDSGDYEPTLDLALARVGWDELRAARAAKIEAGDRLQLGLGVAIYTETTIGITPTHELGAVKLEIDGTITVRVGGTSHGQGHATTFAQMVGNRFGIAHDRVTVLQSDTRLVPDGVSGTFGSRTLQLAGSSATQAADEVIALARRVAAEELEAAEADLVIVPGRGLGVVGVSDAVLEWGEIAAAAQHADITLEAIAFHDSPGPTFPFGTHIAVVEVDMETGCVRLLRHLAVDDVGTIVNPMLAAGQQHGGVVQGIGQALFEIARYDEAGYPLSTNLMGYMLPAAGDVPSIEIARAYTTTSFNPLGAKGVGEVGTLGATPAVHSAVMDVLSRNGVRHLDLPLTPARVWQALHEATS